MGKPIIVLDLAS